MSETPGIDVQCQTAFWRDGELEVSESSVEISLEDFGIDLDHRERSSRLDRSAVSEFGVDDRPDVQQSIGRASEQSALFADTNDDQRTLAGEQADMQCLYGEDPSEVG